MKIVIQKVTLHKIHVELLRKGRYTTGAVDQDLTNVVTQITAAGISGYGEFVMSSLMTGHVNSMAHNPLDEWSALQKACAGLIGKDARGLRRLIPAELEIQDANSVVDAIDFALHDLVGKAHGLPVQALLSGMAKPIIAGMPVVHTDEPDAMIARAGMFYDRWKYRYYKLKPHGVLELDRKVIQGIRSRTTPDARIYIDPNFGLKLDIDGVVDYLNQLAAVGLDTCEDPIDADFETYRLIQSRTPVRLMIDSKARTCADILKIIQARAAQRINIHANWASGFAPAIQKAALAWSAGIQTMIGSTAYVGIGSSAYQVLASVLPGDIPCEQVIGSTYSKTPVSTEYHTRDGMIHIPDAPGLGITVDENALRDLTLEKVVID